MPVKVWVLETKVQAVLLLESWLVRNSVPVAWQGKKVLMRHSNKLVLQMSMSAVQLLLNLLLTRKWLTSSVGFLAMRLVLQPVLRLHPGDPNGNGQERQRH